MFSKDFFTNSLSHFCRFLENWKKRCLEVHDLIPASDVSELPFVTAVDIQASDKNVNFLIFCSNRFYYQNKQI